MLKSEKSNNALLKMIKNAENKLEDVKTQKAFVELKRSEVRPDCEFGKEFAKIEENNLTEKISDMQLLLDNINNTINTKKRKVKSEIFLRFNSLISQFQNIKTNI